MFAYVGLPMDVSEEKAAELEELLRKGLPAAQKLHLPLFETASYKIIFNYNDRIKSIIDNTIFLKNSYVKIISSVVKKGSKFGLSINNIPSLLSELHFEHLLKWDVFSFDNNVKIGKILEYFEEEYMRYYNLYVSKQKKYSDLVNITQKYEAESNNIKNLHPAYFAKSLNSLYYENYYVICPKDDINTVTNKIKSVDFDIIDPIEYKYSKSNDPYTIIQFSSKIKESDNLIKHLNTLNINCVKALSDEQIKSYFIEKESSYKEFDSYSNNYLIFLLYSINGIEMFLVHLHMAYVYNTAILKYGYPLTYIFFAIKVNKINDLLKIIDSWDYTNRLKNTNTRKKNIAFLKECFAIIHINN